MGVNAHQVSSVSRALVKFDAVLEDLRMLNQLGGVNRVWRKFCCFVGMWT